VTATTADSRRRVRVAVWLQTYNHGPFVGQACSGILRQDFEGEVVVFAHDDMSTDATRSEIERALTGAPFAVHRIFQTENQYSQKNHPLDFIPDDQEFDYFVMCEGDDFWSDPQKLQRQVDALEQRPSLDLSFHPARVVDSHDRFARRSGVYADHEAVIPFRDVALQSFGNISTATLMLRWGALRETVAFCRPRPYLGIRDAYLKLFGSRRGGAAFVPQTMATYRLGVQGSWTDRQRAPEARRNHAVARLRGLHEFNAVTAGVHEAEIRRVRKEWLKRLVRISELSMSERWRLLLAQRPTLSRADFLSGSVALAAAEPRSRVATMARRLARGTDA